MAKNTSRTKSNKQTMLFSALNYQLLALGAVLIAVGFVIMYMENEVTGFISLYVSPLMILAGYGIVLLALLKGKDKDNTRTQTASS